MRFEICSIEFWALLCFYGFQLRLEVNNDDGMSRRGQFAVKPSPDCLFDASKGAGRWASLIVTLRSYLEDAVEPLCTSSQLWFNPGKRFLLE